MAGHVLFFKSAGLLPVLLSVILGLGMLLTYVWAVVRNDVTRFVPVISVTGGNAPQSGIFSIFLFLSVATGFVSLLGMILVAVYPVRSWKLLEVNQTQTEDDKIHWAMNVFAPHTVGALFCFLFGLAYATCQSFLSFFAKPALAPCCWEINHVQLFAARIATCTVGFGAFFTMLTANVKFDDLWKDTPGTRIVGGTEWLLLLMLIFFFLSLYPEMKAIQLELKAHALSFGRVHSSTYMSMDDDK